MNKEVSAPRWYVIYTRPKEEDRVDQNLAVLQVETFSPKIKKSQLNEFSGKAVHFKRPMFPRYVFARFDAGNLLHKILYTRGVQRLISINNSPVTVDNEIIDLIRSRVGDDGFVKLYDDLQPGDPVTVNTGSMSGITGIFDRATNDKNRVMIMLGAINYQASVIVDRNSVRKLSSAYCN